MAKLAALQVETPGHDPVLRWEKEFTSDAPVLLGRTDKSEWVAGWELNLSRRHAQLEFEPGKLSVEVLADATNPLDFRGKSYPAGSKFIVHPGERFTVNLTLFEFRDERPTIALDGPTPTESKTVRAIKLDAVSYVDADKRIDALADFHAAIRDANDPEAIHTEVLKILLKGIRLAEAVALVSMPPRDAGSSEVAVLGAEFRKTVTTDFQPSRKLIVESIHLQKEPVIHTWDPTGSGLLTPSSVNEPGSAVNHFDWAFCVPIPQVSGDRIGLYVTGNSPSHLKNTEMEEDDRIERDLKFADLVGKVYASHRRVAGLQKRNDALGRFLSRSVHQALAREDINQVLREREATVTVLFCDLRGSCRISEESQDDLTGLWARISGALSLMTGGIIDQDGVIGDFQGDAAMGFWGWPQLDVPDQVERAARAAIAIRRTFLKASKEEGHPLSGFTCGIGIAHGRAIAGALGTSEQFKISVYGPPVNLASRLESLTKVFDVPILVDEASAAKLAKTAHSCRPLAKIQPYGMIHPLTVHALSETNLGMADDERDDYEAGYNHFLSRNWEGARKRLAKLPRDGSSRLLLKTMEEHGGTAPTDWDGVIVLKSK